MMRQTGTARRLEDLVLNALIAAPRHASIRMLAVSLIAENENFIDGLMQEWRIEFVCRLLRSKKAQLSREEWSKQLVLPGFERLPRTLPSAHGSERTRQSLASATYRDLRLYVARLRERQSQSPRIAQVEAMMKLLTKWRKKLKSREPLTVREAMEREAAQ